MSKFTDYFPSSGGSGVGSGIPINGYFPFIVSSTGDPTGYDSTTGLYTHPDGTFWLKTGNILADSAGVYPDATGATANYEAQGAGITDASTYWFWNGTDILASFNDPSVSGAFRALPLNLTTLAFDFTPAVTLSTSISAALGNFQSGVIIYNQANNEYISFSRLPPLNQPLIEFYNSTMTAITSTVNLTTLDPTNFPNGFEIQTATVDWPNNMMYIRSNKNPTTIHQFDIATKTLTGLSYTSLFPGGTTLQSLAFDPVANTIWQGGLSGGGSSSPFIETAITTGIATGRSFDAFPDTPNTIFEDGKGATNGLNKMYAESRTNVSPQYRANKYDVNGFPNVGDSTARTDTDSAQPLFVRLK